MKLQKDYPLFNLKKYPLAGKIMQNGENELLDKKKTFVFETNLQLKSLKKIIDPKKEKTMLLFCFSS
ncbi:hypothetical protein ACFFWB_26705 [Flavobacterium procerum]|uniref:hypothetical protein n=1 Tax=Flavobacterium procerum TaxID=1455569 RepID=UPI0035E9A079